MQVTCKLHQVTQVTPSNIFEHGVRDENLFHIATNDNKNHRKPQS